MGKFRHITTHYRFINHEEIGGYFGMRGSAISQLSRRFKETIKGDRELGGILRKVKKEGFLNAET